MSVALVSRVFDRRGQWHFQVIRRTRPYDYAVGALRYFDPDQGLQSFDKFIGDPQQCFAKHLRHQRKNKRTRKTQDTNKQMSQNNDDGLNASSPQKASYCKDFCSLCFTDGRISETNATCFVMR